jgi:hypothetical protein
VQDIQKYSLNFGQFHALTFSALARIIKGRQVNLSVRVTVRSGMSIRGKAATASLWFLCPFLFHKSCGMEAEECGDAGCKGIQ